MITITGLHKRLGGQPVLRGIDLEIERGQVVAITGPSGAGKSVLLRHIIGLLRPDAGDVLVDGVSVPGASRVELYRLRRRMGYAFQDAALLDSLDVADNLRLALADDGAEDRADGRARNGDGGGRNGSAARSIAEALALVNLPLSTLTKRPAELSGGMRKRVGVARAVINRPAVVLYDEPTTGLDPANADNMYALIRRIADASGATSLVVAHDIHLLGTFADRVITLAEGRVVADGPPRTGRLAWS
jgi:phospholipid/cholesterol/gamma-HCH transport system ATP-binding protein